MTSAHPAMPEIPGAKLTLRPGNDGPLPYSSVPVRISAATPK